MSTYKEITFTDEDVIDPGNWIPDGDYNPHKMRPFLLHDHGFTLCVVFADCASDAIDIAVDNGKLDRFFITPEELDEYDEDSISHHGSAGEPFDLESLGVEELPNPKRSFCAQFDLESK